jgi:hypothetical protein
MHVTLSHVRYPVVRERPPQPAGLSRASSADAASELKEPVLQPTILSKRETSPSPTLKKARKLKAENAQSPEPN